MTIVLVVIVVFLLLVGVMFAAGLRPQKSRNRTRSRTGGGNKGGTGI
jgi:preprotein translocase subunit YajC